MKKLVILGAFTLMLLMQSCDKHEEGITEPATAATGSKLKKTPDMQDFERTLTGVAEKLQKGQITHDQAVEYNVANATLYLSQNGVVVDESLSGDDIIHKALEFHLQKIQQLQTNKKP